MRPPQLNSFPPSRYVRFETIVLLYEYDKNGNCTSSKTTYSDSNNETLIYYEYDEHNSVTKETIKHYSSDEYVGEEIYTYNYLYDDGLCIEEEYLADYTNSTISPGIVITAYYINTYDENRNIEIKKDYSDVCFDSDCEEIERNGKKFGLSDTVYYSYAKLSDLTSISSSSTISQTTSNSVTTDPYNGLPAPVELKIVNSNGKKAMKNDTSYEMDYSMYLIEDYHGLKYLVLTCSATSKYSDRKVNGPDFFPITITKSNMELTHVLDDEVEQAYDEIIFSGGLGTTLYPGEVVKDSYIYDFYGEKENITVVLKPPLHGNVTNGGNNNYIHGIYTGNYSFSENEWDEYIFLEFAF